MALPPGLGIPQHLQQMFQKTAIQPYSSIKSNQYGPSVKPLGKGSLISFNYTFWKHDPYPLVIVTDIFQNYIRGVNLHYLTFQYIKTLLQNNCDNVAFSYYNIKLDKYITNSFRTYKRPGIRLVKKMDCSFLLNIIGMVKSFDLNEVNKIRDFVRGQLASQVNPKAEQVQSTFTNIITGQ